MRTQQPLSRLKPGQEGVVAALTADGGMRRRLQDLGLIQGTSVTCLQRSPLGDPVAYHIRGAVIALRAADASLVLVEREA